MSDFTYEHQANACKLETFEWDNVWIDHANDAQMTRVLYVGDSISCGIRRTATALSENRIYFDGFGTSKALDNPYFLDALLLFAKQQPRRDLILFNNGLHGWHLEDETEYKTLYRAFVQGIRSAFPDTPLLLILTTGVSDAEREERVQKRNRAVLEIASELSLPIIDLYSASVEHVQLRAGDGVHFTPQGYEILAQTILQSVQKTVRD